jgi:transcriptional regulator with XRE-family HTH domain
MTQEQLGEKLGVTNKTVSRWENGNYMPDVEKLSLLSKEFGVSITELISGERLAAEDFKTAADKNLITALNNSTFALKIFQEEMAARAHCNGRAVRRGLDWVNAPHRAKTARQRCRNAFGRDWRDGCRAVLCDTV